MKILSSFNGSYTGPVNIVASNNFVSPLENVINIIMSSKGFTFVISRLSVGSPAYTIPSIIYIWFLFLLFAIVMFMRKKIPLGLTSMIVCVGLVVTGVLEWQTAFAGFIDSNVILFVAMFIVGGALFETGMANKIGGIVTHFAKTERQLIVAIMVIVGVMSGFLSNTGTAAILIPVVIGIAAKSGYSRSRLLMPLVLQQRWEVTSH